jgi:hypothetical protein
VYPLALITALALTPNAHAAGGDVVVLTYPSLVKTSVTRTKRALRQSLRLLDDGQTTRAATSLTVVRRQLNTAWRNAKYVIRTTPPPPPSEARAHVSGGGPTGPTKAAPADTAYLVLALQHTVASSLIADVDGADAGTVSLLATTLNFTLSLRNQAAHDIRALAPPAPPADDRATAAGGGPVVSTFDTVMPNVVGDLDDELQAIDGIRSESDDLTSSGRQLLGTATTKISRTRGFVNRTWPPVPVED